MTRRLKGFGLLVAGRVAALAILASGGLVTAQTDAPRISFIVATGPSGGTYFPVGQALADIVSHPPGVARCDTPDVCGPSGLIASARTSARALLAAYRIAERRIKESNDAADVAAQKLQRGESDAFVFVGGAPVTLIE